MDEKNNEDITVIQITKKTRERLKTFLSKVDTYDTGINKILDILENLEEKN